MATRIPVMLTNEEIYMLISALDDYISNLNRDEEESEAAAEGLQRRLSALRRLNGHPIESLVLGQARASDTGRSSDYCPQIKGGVTVP